MKNSSTSKIQALIRKGIRIPNPASIDIGAEVDPDKISGDGVFIHTGCKIFGSSTVILRGVQLGYEGPATVVDCQIGPKVELKGGFFKDSVFLESAKMGFGAHVREGTILEEQASGAHTVALKQTILFPFVTLGSLINFCDCFMAGGTDRKNHSEVGSSYIHFNFTPNQDKATPSLIGDVPGGVMLNQRPIFLGGQGGVVGPCRLAYGTTIAAGTIYRHDELRPGRLIFGGAGKGGNIAYTPGRRQLDKRIIKNNIIYIANLFALMQWYQHVRQLFISREFPQLMLEALKQKLTSAIDERIKRLGDYCLKLPTDPPPNKKSVSKDPKTESNLPNQWPMIQDYLTTRQDHGGDTAIRDAFLENLNQAIKNSDKNYIAAISALAPGVAQTGTRWLQGIVDKISTEALELMQ
jgi:UDP-N-acetylglucosamine/UDP-N-acetylgalactosamine diphosphorylase